MNSLGIEGLGHVLGVAGPVRRWLGAWAALVAARAALS